MANMSFTQSKKAVFSKWLRVAILLGFSPSLSNGLQAQCNPDITPPTCTPPSSVVVNCDVFDPTLAAYGSVSATDNCCLAGVNSSVYDSTFLGFCNKGIIIRTYTALDCAGNASTCSQTITVSNIEDYYLKLPPNLTVPLSEADGNYGDPEFHLNDCEQVAASYSDEINTTVPGLVYQIKRTWTIINWCQYDPLIQTLTIIPNPGSFTGWPIVSPTGTTAPWAPTVIDVQPSGPFINYADYHTPTGNGYRYLQIINVMDDGACAVSTVDLSTPYIVPCQTGAYTVSARNLTSTTAEDAYVEVKLANYLSYAGSSLTGTALGNNTYSFELGDLAGGEQEYFTINFTVGCEAPSGYTHQTKAKVFPDAQCGVSPQWSRADVKVSALCQGDSVYLSIANEGTGNMTTEQEFVVVEDVIMYRKENFKLDAGESLTLVMPASGSTWRLQAGQEPLHPYVGLQYVSIEGCGGLNTPGIVNQFPLSPSNPSEALDGQQNTATVGSTDLKAFPSGYGSSHFIDKNIDIEYLVRFQNTGNSAATSVTVLDPLPIHLDEVTVSIGASSHPVTVTLGADRVLQFQIDNVNIPPSSENVPASFGFVKFRISQKADLTDGTLIENNANIKFGGSSEVTTNTVFHTVGTSFIEVVGITQSPTTISPLSVTPNPARDAVWFEWKTSVEQGLFTMTNQFGSMVFQDKVEGSNYQFKRNALPAGMYYFKMTCDQNQVYTGKIILK